MEKLWTVTELNGAMKAAVEGALPPLWLSAEIGTYKESKAHLFLTLKDARCQMEAVLWNGAEMARRLGLGVGARVEARGRPGVYLERGQLRFTIDHIRPAGLGDLMRLFEELKARLAAEGLFDRKRPIPRMPRAIGVVTSPTGAVVQDILRVVSARFPRLRVLIYPSAVQGRDAAREVAEGIRFFNRRGGVDAILVARGGGSLEDLWPFNEEALVRAVAASRIPVVSAVGHETDVTLCDFAADLRAATPSNAAELLVPVMAEVEERLAAARRRLAGALLLRLQSHRRRLDRLAASRHLADPRRLVEDRRQRVADLWEAMARAAAARLDRARARLGVLSATCAACSPAAVLGRGYAILAEAESGRAITSAAPRPSGERVKAILRDGALRLAVE